MGQPLRSRTLSFAGSRPLETRRPRSRDRIARRDLGIVDTLVTSHNEIRYWGKDIGAGALEDDVLDESAEYCNPCSQNLTRFSARATLYDATFAAH